MSINAPRSGAGSRPALVVAMALCTLLMGCASSQSTAPPSELASSGWSDASALAPVADFDAYVVDVKKELR
ncbi:MAG: hypothetical protein ACK5ZA_01935, partial [Betaproteobacteria bacterium]